MKILIVEGPGRHPESYPRALGGALHRQGHVAVVHPLGDPGRRWAPRLSLARHARKLLEVHAPDIVHVVSSEPWIADAFTGRGTPVIHSTEDRASTADVIIVPTRIALATLTGLPVGAEHRVVQHPYAVTADGESTGYGSCGLATFDPADADAAAWVEQACERHPFLPVRTEGDVEDARFVIVASTRRQAWVPGLAEAMAAGRPVLAGWVGVPPEYVLEGVTGFLSEPGDVASLAAQMAWLWDHPEEARRMGEEARRRAVPHFDPELHARAVVRLYLRAGASRLAV